MDEQRWRDEGWLAGAHAWIAAEVARLGAQPTGDSEQRHVRLWSTVLRVPTDQGDLWFKANDATMLHEGRVVAAVSARCPELVPPLLAHDEQRGWMLMADAGEWLRSVAPREGSLDRWRDVLRRYSAAQIAVTDCVDDLLAAGVPDRRLPTLAGDYAALMDKIEAGADLRAGVRLVTELVDELESYGIAETLQHDDLHDGQVFVKDGAHLVMDWGDACISHPFFTLSVTLDGVVAWGLDDVAHSVDVQPFQDAYLAPFRELYQGDLDAACTTARRLGWACRAVNGHVAGDDAATRSRLAMFLDGTV